MPKRSFDSEINFYEEKIKKLKELSKKKRKRVIVYSSSSESEENQDDGPTQDDANIAECPLPEVQTSTESNYEVQAEQLQDAPPELDPELLSALGDPTDEQPAYGENIHHTLAQRWIPILKKGLTKTLKDTLLKDYLIPDNCKLLKAPTLNPEVKAAVSEITINRDKNIQNKQDQLGLGITAINKAMTLLLLGNDKIQAIKVLSDGCRILTDLHYTETQVRTKLITPCLDKTFTPLLKDHERDETLFGEKLSETIKASKAIERQGSQIKKFTPRAMSVPAATAGTSAKNRFPGNCIGSPRYPSNRGGRGGPPRAATTYRRPAPAPAPVSRPRASSSANTRHRAYPRR